MHVGHDLSELGRVGDRQARFGGADGGPVALLIDADDVRAGASDWERACVLAGCRRRQADFEQVTAGLGHVCADFAS